jgi:hypothetical protein
MNALTMITKAGVPSNKVLVGVSSYGRSFQMADPSCTGPTCLYTGDNTTSYARKGRCTQTSGYLANAEINEIGGRTWTDIDSNSLIMVDGDLRVSYVDDNLKQTRTQLYKNYELGGTIDWAVDLAQFHDPPSSTPGGVFLEDWVSTKAQIKEGVTTGGVTCEQARLNHTSGWINKTCSMAEVTKYHEYTPEEVDCHGLPEWLE